MTRVFLLFATLLFISQNSKADYIEKGSFICRSSELLDEMISIAVKMNDAKNSGNQERVNSSSLQLASLMMNGQCSIADKKYSASMLDRGFSKHKIRVYDDSGKNFVVWTIVESYHME